VQERTERGGEQLTLDAVVRVRRGGFELHTQVRVAAGRVLAVVGPNGAGKTSLLRALAGLEPLLAGRVALGGAVLEDAAAGVRVPPERRPVGYVFQDYRLFPHLSALDNVAFGLRATGAGRAAARAAAAPWLERVGLAGLAHQRPAALSGGQAQRVALARALVTRPGLLLLDEPLSALDAGTRATLRSELRRLVAEYEGCCLTVTHDPLDALVLADTIAVLEGGRVVQSGTPTEVARHPRTEYVARLVGLNLHRGTAERATSGGTVIRLAGGGELATSEAVSGPALAAFPPTAVAIYRSRPDGSPRNCWPATVADLEPHGGTIRVRLTGPPDALADVTPAAVAELGLAPGQPVWASVKAVEVTAYPA
jgi:molybdate transport system ATP-binding protein